METKEELIENIKEWIKIDNEITKLKSEIRDKNNKKKQITEGLLNVMKKNEIDCFDINGGSLVYKKNKVKKTLTGKTLLTALQSYYVNQPNTAEELTNKNSSCISVPVPDISFVVLERSDEILKEGNDVIDEISCGLYTSNKSHTVKWGAS